MKDIGLRLQVGHADGLCPTPENAFNNDFVIIAHNGIHKVSLDYCACDGAASKPVQLIRTRLYPATVQDPKTAATFAVLEHFQLLSFTSKLSHYEYYRALTRLTDNTGVGYTVVSYFNVYDKTLLIEYFASRIVIRPFLGSFISGIMFDC